MHSSCATDRFTARVRCADMHVTAFSNPRQPKWRWRITDSNGLVLEESETVFATISAALAAGRQQLVHVSGEARPPEPRRPWGTRHYVRGPHV
jgi:hypothetical protein